MSEAAHAHHPNYVKIWGILCGLLVISVAGPFLEIPIITLITAFGIAIVKAYLVCANFMHLNVEKRYIVYLLSTMLIFVLLFFSATAPDVMKFEGTNWTKPIVLMLPPPDHHGEGGDESHAPAAGHGAH